MPTDWSNLMAVVEYARRLGRGLIVFQRAGEANYAITHAARPDRWEMHKVVYRT
jgi:hypothetical protein